MFLLAGAWNRGTAHGITTEPRRVLARSGRPAMASIMLKEDTVQIQNDSTTAVGEGTNYIIESRNALNRRSNDPSILNHHQPARIVRVATGQQYAREKCRARLVENPRIPAVRSWPPLKNDPGTEARQRALRRGGPYLLTFAVARAQAISIHLRRLGKTPPYKSAGGQRNGCDLV
ncbi:hypothetical protein FA13DRAFT_1722049 [Coprinellus micaceus]|uniref:Uncharacterized protein n=1 Tax=Coprinellus micaceus TaxID=71717 RepID=A0A4Y7RTM3_COPMI|nr:hypothetical protein FA13DRAFT_1722049 [Coprinellus micaceus]